MSFKPLLVVVLAFLVLVAGTASAGQSRQRGNSGKGMGQQKSMPNAFQATQNQAKQIQQQQHNVWVAKRRAQAEARAAGDAAPTKKSSAEKSVSSSNATTVAKPDAK